MTTRVPEAPMQSTLASYPESPASTPSPQRWLKEPDPNWQFWWKGAVPAGLLALLSVYTLLLVAYHAQSYVQQQVTHALEQQGLSWVDVKTSGLDIYLSGSPPSQAAASAAQKFAREAKCNTWFGAMPCVSRVQEAFARPKESAPPPGHKLAQARTSTNAIVPVANSGASHPGTQLAIAQEQGDSNSQAVTSASVAVESSPAGPPRFYDLKLVVSPVTARLEGEVPDESSKLELQRALEQAFSTRESLPQVYNELLVNGGVPDGVWSSAVKLAVGMAAQCTTGYVALQQAALTVDCETQTSAQRSRLIAAGADIPAGVTVTGLNVLALDEIQQCEQALVKLVSRAQIRFTTNSASLLPTSRPLLREIAHQLERCPGVVVVEGHTDAQGVREENLTLSLNRARAVVASLVGYGVTESRVRAEGYGPDKPLATNETATGRAQNRRIEFRVARSSEFAPTSAPTSVRDGYKKAQK